MALSPVDSSVVVDFSSFLLLLLLALAFPFYIPKSYFVALGIVVVVVVVDDDSHSSFTFSHTQRRRRRRHHHHRRRRHPSECVSLYHITNGLFLSRSHVLHIHNISVFGKEYVSRGWIVFFVCSSCFALAAGWIVYVIQTLCNKTEIRNRLNPLLSSRHIIYSNLALAMHRIPRRNIHTVKRRKGNKK